MRLLNMVIAAVLIAAVCIALTADIYDEAEATKNRDSRSKQEKARGAELIHLLGEPKTRVAAFRELAMRYRDDALSKLNSAEVIVCPQGENTEPIYLVLTKSNYARTSTECRSSGYPVENPEELFGPPPPYPEEPLPPHGQFDKRGDLAIYAFTSNGRMLMPFGGKNLLGAGIIADINGDGMVERADFWNCGVEGVEHAMIFEICTAAKHSKTLLRVLYNWGPKADWDYQFADRDGDGKIEIEFGPVISPDVVKAKVVFAWSEDRKRYGVTQGEGNAHIYIFSRHDCEKDLWQLSEQLKKQKFTFPADPEAKSEARTNIVSCEEPEAPPRDSDLPPPTAKPYRRGSLKNLTNAQISAYMGRGKNSGDYYREHRIDTHLPPGFWEMPAKQAAAALIDANRDSRHRRFFRLAIDDRDGRQPPETCTLYYSNRSRRCYITYDPCYFLHVDKDKAYVAHTAVYGLGVVFYNVVEDQPAYDLRCAEVPVEDAKHISDVIWWLRRARTWTAYEDLCFGYTGSSGDGSGALRLQSRNGVELEAEGRIWAYSPISERWDSHFEGETLVNFADYLIKSALLERLGEQWTCQKPTCEMRPRILAEEKTKTSNAQEEAASQLRLDQQYREQVGRLIGLFSRDQSRLPHSMLRVAVEAAGDSLLNDFREPLLNIYQQLPEPEQPVRTRREVAWLLDKAEVGANIDEKTLDEKKLSAIIEKLWNAPPQGDALRKELKDIEHGLRPDAAQAELRQAVLLAMYKIACADDREELLKAAQSGDPSWRWAMSRLRKIDKPRFVEAMEYWMRKSSGKAARQFYQAIQETDPQKALEIAENLTPDERSDLIVDAYSVLEQAQAVADMDRRIDALIAVMLNREAGWEQREKAVDLLVPEEVPLKHPDRKIDAALLKVFDPEQADFLTNFTLSKAFNALVMRGRIEYFDRMFQRLLAEKSGHVHCCMRVSLTRLALLGTDEQREKLSNLLGEEMKISENRPSQKILCLYALDRREWKNVMEQIGTLGPNEYEGPAYLRADDDDKPSIHFSHDARKIAAIWNEEDPLTRAKLLVALGFQAQYSAWFGDVNELVADTVLGQLRESADSLSSEQAGRVVEFVDWCENNANNQREAETEFGKAVRGLFVR